MKTILALICSLLMTGSLLAESATATWQASVTPGVTGYRVYRNQSMLTATTNLTYVDTPLEPGTSYTYYVTALGADGTESEPSNTVTVMTPGVPPPDPPPQDGTCITSNTNWQSRPFTAQTGVFSYRFTGRASASGVDSVFGLSANPATSYNDLAVIPQFGPNGVIEARNGGSYQAVERVVYVPQETYLFRASVDIPAKRYSLWVTGTDDIEHQIASGYQFRTQQNSVQSLGHFNTTAEEGSATWCGFTLDTEPPTPQPVRITVTPETLTIETGRTLQFVASVTGTTNTAVTWMTTIGTISGTGFFTAPATAGTGMVTATSVADSSKVANAAVTVTAAPPPTGDRTYTFTRTVTSVVDPAPISVDPPAVTVTKTLRCTVTVPASGGEISEVCTEQ